MKVRTGAGRGSLERQTPEPSRYGLRTYRGSEFLSKHREAVWVATMVVCALALAAMLVTPAHAATTTRTYHAVQEVYCPLGWKPVKWGTDTKAGYSYETVRGTKFRYQLSDFRYTKMIKDKRYGVWGNATMTVYHMGADGWGQGIWFKDWRGAVGTRVWITCKRG
jgi:hypothetical protein